MTLNDDVPLRAPSLQHLSAAAVSKSPSLLVDWAPGVSNVTAPMQPATPLPKATDVPTDNRPMSPAKQPDHPLCSVERPDAAKPCLPTASSEAVFNSFVGEWRDGRFAYASVVEETLAEFSDGRRFPLESIDLQKTEITSEQLHRLLVGQADNVRQLNLIACDRLDDAAAQRCATLTLPHLHTLQLSNAHMFQPWTLTKTGRRHQRYFVASAATSPIAPSMMAEDEEEMDEEDDDNEDIVEEDDDDNNHHLVPPPSGGSALATIDTDDPLADTPPDSPSPLTSIDDDEDGGSANYLLTARCRSLQRLTFFGHSFTADLSVDDDAAPDFLAQLLSPSTSGGGEQQRLRLLDLSYWRGLRELRFVRPAAPTLTQLVLFNVPDLYHAVATICDLAELTYLDISQSSRDTGTYPKPVTTLYRLVTSLRKLTHLDISSTNLAAQPSKEDWPAKESLWVKSDIAGLYGLERRLELLGLFGCDAASHYAELPAAEVTGDANEDQMMSALRRYASRSQLLQAVLNEVYQSVIAGLYGLERRLELLGLFGCDAASHYAELPAAEVTGDANEDQMMSALRRYSSRSQLLQAVLNEVYQLYRFGSEQRRFAEALHLVLTSMQRHMDDGTLQIAGSASLFYILKHVNMNRVTKRNVVLTLIRGMEIHIDEQVMVRNCCLSLCQFEIPQEVLFDYGRVATLLVRVLEKYGNDQLAQKIVVFMLNSMACHVEGEQKVQVGNLGAIEIVLKQIAKRHEMNKCDDVMEVSWSFLWNITDETPVNCERFLKGQGLKLFYNCYKSFPSKRKLQRNMMGLMKFPDKIELIRNMMGLMGNLAEVKQLRPQLMEGPLLEIFCSLLENLSDGIEISYNSAGVLAHLCGDSDAVWLPDTDALQREAVQQSIIKATESWQLNARRFINYRSFKPIIGLLAAFDAPGSQHWATWALANLTSTDGRKYCPFVENEGGVPLLRNIVLTEGVLEKTKELASSVLSNVEKWNRNELPLPSEEPPEAEDVEVP